MSESRLRIGYIPLVDAAALIVAVDHGFAAAEGLDVDLVREGVVVASRFSCLIFLHCTTMRQAAIGIGIRWFRSGAATMPFLSIKPLQSRGVSD
jgi:hypothetical protein